MDKAHPAAAPGISCLLARVKSARTAENMIVKKGNFSIAVVITELLR